MAKKTDKKMDENELASKTKGKRLDPKALASEGQVPKVKKDIEQAKPGASGRGKR